GAAAAAPLDRAVRAPSAALGPSYGDRGDAPGRRGRGLLHLRAASDPNRRRGADRGTPDSHRSDRELWLLQLARVGALCPPSRRRSLAPGVEETARADTKYGSARQAMARVDSQARARGAASLEPRAAPGCRARPGGSARSATAGV